MKKRESWEKSVRITQIATLMDKHLTGKIEVLDTRFTDKITGFQSFQPRVLSSQTPADVRLWKFEYFNEQTISYPVFLPEL